jgi:transcriptional regulator with XRE-family HTH domain
MREAESEFTARQVRAGRALLAWSQSDLANAARVALSTVADFERGQRRPVANNAQAIRDALQARGVRFMAGGVVSAEQLPPPPLRDGVGSPMRWVRAVDLAQWGERRDGQAGLPELLSRLIYATRGHGARVRFPSDESINFPGWDGVCEVDVETIYIPSGWSGWEIGAQRAGIAGKADGDYAKRRADPQGLDPSKTTFVFVTPQRWSGKEKWATEKRADRFWRDVRAFDADDLVHWLEENPGVAVWLAVRVGRRPDGLREISEVWDEWALATRTPLTVDLLVIDRDDQATAVLRWLQGPPAVLSVQAEAVDEAMAFLHAALQPLPEAYRLFWESRCLVAESEKAARKLIGLGPKLVVVLAGGEPGLAEKLVGDGHHVYAAYGSDVGSPADVLRLGRPWSHNLSQGLEDLGLEPARAHQLATTCGRSLAVLRRMMPSGPGRRPAWASSPPPASLLAAMLAGAWRQDFSVDRKILEQLSGRSYADLESELTPFAAMLDGPLRHCGETWKLASLRDAWFLLAPFLTSSQIESVEACFQEVLGAASPGFDGKLDAHWRIERDGGGRPSGELRRGLSEAMIALGVFHEQATNVPDANCRAPRAIRALLSNADERVWWSLSRDFQRLAEASPRTFLECVDEALDSDRRPLRALFRSDEGLIHPIEYLSALLWALEILAWSPSELAPAALLLARLAEVDPGGRTLNRPSNSLRRIFLPWSPQTYATAAERLRVLDLIVRKHPAVGWRTLLSLAPRPHDTSDPSPLPVWRDFTTGNHEEVTWSGVAKAHREIGERLLSLVGDEASRWISLLEHWAHFEPGWREQAAAKLATVVEAFMGSAREQFREALRKLLYLHESFPDVDWSMTASDLAPLSAIFDALEPQAATARHAWLFNSSSAHWQRGRRGRESHEAVEAAQIAAASEILAENGPEEVMRFARSVQLTTALGMAIASAKASWETKQTLLEAALEDEDASAGDLALGMLFQLRGDLGNAWLEERFAQAVRDRRKMQALLRLALALPVNRSSWREIKAASSELERCYWRELKIGHIREEVKDVALACRKLMQADCPHRALELAGGCNEAALPSGLLIRILKAVAAPTGNDERRRGNDEVMFSFYLANIFRRLDQAKDVDADEMVRLEWIYFQELEHSERPPRTLHKALASHPDFFAELVRAIYSPSPDTGVEEPPVDPKVAKAVASHAFRVLRNWSQVPGSDETGEIDGLTLETWVKEARKLCAEKGRAQFGDQQIGEILAVAPRRDGEVWPPEPVRNVIEISRSRDLEEGFEIGVYNRRGFTMRSLYEGGEQERALAATLRADARALALEWPRTRAVLERIAETYDRDAKREDQSAEQRDW